MSLERVTVPKYLGNNMKSYSDKEPVTNYIYYCSKIFLGIETTKTVHVPIMTLVTPRFAL